MKEKTVRNHAIYLIFNIWLKILKNFTVAKTFDEQMPFLSSEPLRHEKDFIFQLSGPLKVTLEVQIKPL